jgi:hypothetical protein
MKRIGIYVEETRRRQAGCMSVPIRDGIRGEGHLITPVTAAGHAFLDQL